MSSFRGDVLAMRPSLFWIFGDRGTDTTVRDLSGNGRDGTYTGTLTRGTSPAFTRLEAGATLDGSTGYIQRAYDAAFDIGAGDLAIAAWVNFAASGSGVHPIFQRDTGATGNGIQFNLQDSGNIVTLRLGGTLLAQLNTPVTTGAPHFFVATRRSSLAEVWMDAALIKSASMPNSIQTGGRIQVGHDDNPLFANGPVFAVAFWHTRGLSPAEILALNRSSRGFVSPHLHARR